MFLGRLVRVPKSVRHCTRDTSPTTCRGSILQHPFHEPVVTISRGGPDRSPAMIRKPFGVSVGPANELENRPRQYRAGASKQGRMIMSGKAVLENVRRYRAIASLYRQTAAFRPPQRLSLLEQAGEWERLALLELESYFSALHQPFMAMAAAA